MKRVIAACVIALAGTAQASTIFLDFAGPFAVTNWNFATTDDGTVDTSGAPASIVLTGGNFFEDVDSESLSTTDFTIELGQDTLISFSWDYETEDVDAFFDPFGYLLGTGPGSLLFTQLTADFTTAPQSGTASVFVQAGETFGFRAFSIGSNYGPGTTTIGEFRAVVPEPSALALVSLALLVGATVRRGRRQ